MLPHEKNTIEQELAAVYRLYSAFTRELDPETGLGGRLLYAGELDPAGCRLIRAANIAGAASLAASADAAVQRQAIREGAVDFLVTTLDEALRILKNEIRKRLTVAVCVAEAPEKVMQEMAERGVQPDLLAPSAAQAVEGTVFLARGARRVEAEPRPEGKQFLVLEIPAALAQRIADFDALLAESIDAADYANRRWLRLSPRYLGPAARRLRSLECDEETAEALAQRFSAVDCAG
jgi:urocanate hydratase